MTEQPTPQQFAAMVKYLSAHCRALATAVADNDARAQFDLLEKINAYAGEAGLLVAYRAIADCWAQWSGNRETLARLRAADPTAHMTLAPGEGTPVDDDIDEMIVAAHRFMLAHINGDDEGVRSVFEEWGSGGRLAALGAALSTIAQEEYAGGEWAPNTAHLHR